MYKFDGLDPASWISQMEQYFLLHGIQDEHEKINMGAL